MTFVANYIPLQVPDGGPNFYTLRRRRGVRDEGRQQRRRQRGHQSTSSASAPRPGTRTRSSTTPGRSRRLDDPDWNVRQFYTVTRVDGGAAPSIASPGQRSRPRRQHRPAVDPELHHPRGARPSRPSPTAGRSSPGSATTPSTSTWARSSTSLGLRPFNPAPRDPAAGSPAWTASAASTRTPSRCRCRSRCAQGAAYGLNVPTSCRGSTDASERVSSAPNGAKSRGPATSCRSPGSGTRS